MIMAKRRVEMMVETERVVLRGRKPQVSWCENCGAPSLKLTIEQMTIVTGEDESTISRLIESSVLHQSRSTDGLTRICLHSLMVHLHRPNRFP
jgi:hypothetical protein